MGSNKLSCTRDAYLEEPLAEGYGQLKVHGLVPALRAYRFPILHGYVTVSQLGGEGHAIGAVTIGGVLLNVSLSRGELRGTPMISSDEAIAIARARTEEKRWGWADSRINPHTGPAFFEKRALIALSTQAAQ